MKQRAFTIIELVAVAATIALLAGIMFIRAGRTGSRAALMRAGRELYLTARYARAEAVQTGRQISLMLDQKQRSFCLTAKDDGQEQEIIANACSRPYKLPDRVNIERVKIDAAECLFYPDGGAEPALIQMTDGRSRLTVLVNAMGRVRIAEGVVADTETGKIDLDEK